jgi:hypothetical protein
MNIDDPMLGGLTPEQAARALTEGRLGLDFGGPATTLGDRVARYLYVDAMNRKLERMGVPLRIESGRHRREETE